MLAKGTQKGAADLDGYFTISEAHTEIFRLHSNVLGANLNLKQKDRKSVV